MYTPPMNGLATGGGDSFLDFKRIMASSMIHTSWWSTKKDRQIGSFPQVLVGFNMQKSLKPPKAPLHFLNILSIDPFWQ